MGLKERQERDREAVSRSILDAARELFVTHGYQEVSIRKIAEKIEYSPAAIYSYFPSKDDIFFALAEEGFRLLFSYGASPRAADADSPDDPDDPIGAIRAMFWRYYEFSKEHPEYFALMFLDRSVPRISKNWSRFGFVSEGSTLMVARIRLPDAQAHSRGARRIVLVTVVVLALGGAAAVAHSGSSEPRASYFHVAWHDQVLRHPLLGTGAGQLRIHSGDVSLRAHA